MVIKIKSNSYCSKYNLNLNVKRAVADTILFHLTYTHFCYNCKISRRIISDVRCSARDPLQILIRDYIHRVMLHVETRDKHMETRDKHVQNKQVDRYCS